MQKLRNLIHKNDPYKGFIKENYFFDPQGWGSEAPIFTELIKQVKPSLIIEVGSWKGGSAITMGNAIKRENLECEILCVDTWSGAPEFWVDHSDPERFLSLKLQNGYPTVYYQFLANMCYAGIDDVVTPVPLPSTVAAQVFKKKRIQADIIYIDGSHEYHDVFFDILTWIPLLKNGGIIFGDDYDEYWPSVVNAVKDVNKYLGVTYEVVDNRNWVIKNTNGLEENLLEEFIKNTKEKKLDNTPILKIALDRLLKRLK
jgi:hypothetical protein